MGGDTKKTADCPERASYKKYREFIDLNQFIRPPSGQFRPGTRHFVVLPVVELRPCNEDYIREKTRYASFVSVNPSPEWPSRLAQDGYFVDGSTGVIKCFFCGHTREHGHAGNCARMDENVPFSHPLENPPDPANETRVTDPQELNIQLPALAGYDVLHDRGRQQETRRPRHQYPLADRSVRGDQREAQRMSRIHADYEDRRCSFNDHNGLREFAQELALQGYYSG